MPRIVIIFVLAISVLLIAVVASSDDTESVSLDLSRLTKSEQASANAHICLAGCDRNSSLDRRFERSRYDQYYDSDINPNDPDCVELTCLSSERRADVGAICRARADTLFDDVNCVLKCRAIGAIYDTSFEDNLFKAISQDRLVGACNRLNASPFSDSDDTCPDALGGNALDCSVYRDILEPGDDGSESMRVTRSDLQGAVFEDWLDNLERSKQLEKDE